MAQRLIPLDGRKFGTLTVLGIAGQNKHNHWLWDCSCECGGGKVVRGNDLRAGKVSSCGCGYAFKTTTHGLTKHPTHICWVSMRQRCRNPRSHCYRHYGGRGITIAPEWDSFQSFYAWSVKNGWEPGLEIDRIDNDGPYSPSNCRWTTRAVNCGNQRRGKRVEQAEKGNREADKAAERIEKAPPTRECKTPEIILNSDL